MQNKDCKKLYELQNKVLDFINKLNFPFYLTGGTALGRFYLNHRFSQDLDFFVNDNTNFPKYIDNIYKKFQNQFQLDKELTFIREEFARFIIKGKKIWLKVEFVNDVAFRYSKPILFKQILVDNVRNILSNKISAIIGRDEAKDIFDIICISKNYNFNWYDVFMDAKAKSALNEIDVLRRIDEFPVEWLKDIEKIDFNRLNFNQIKSDLKIISNDFLMAKDNSLGINCIKIEEAYPHEF
jgi:predicted nucleotidyltransferase component of viral defense system